MHRMSKPAPLLLALFVVACSGSDSGDGAEGLGELVASSGALELTIELESAGDALGVGQNALLITVTDLGGVPVTDANVTVDPQMPSMWARVERRTRGHAQAATASTSSCFPRHLHHGGRLGGHVRRGDAGRPEWTRDLQGVTMSPSEASAARAAAWTWRGQRRHGRGQRHGHGRRQRHGHGRRQRGSVGLLIRLKSRIR